MVWIIVIAIVVLIVLWIFATQNKLVRKRMKAENAFADIDVHLVKRYDLIPNIVNTVKGYAKHEKETLEGVINARNKAVSAGSVDDKINADNEVTEAISRLFALTESYPELKANTNFQALQQELTETESKIAAARQFYNDTVMVYNNKVSMVPSNIIASLFKFNKEAFFEANETERQNVQVKF